jgi:hypothetical protein
VPGYLVGYEFQNEKFIKKWISSKIEVKSKKFTDPLNLYSAMSFKNNFHINIKYFPSLKEKSHKFNTQIIALIVVKKNLSPYNSFFPFL